MLMLPLAFLELPLKQNRLSPYCVYLHSEMLNSRVLSIHVKCLVLWHRQHLLEVCLNSGTVLVVDCVTVADRGALVLPDVRLGHVEPGVGEA